MQNDIGFHTDQKYAPWLMLVILTGYSLVGLFGFLLISQAMILPFFNFDLEALREAITYPTEAPNARLPLLISQGITSLGAFFVMPLLFMRRFMKTPLSSFFSAPMPFPQPLAMTAIITFSFMVVNSIVVEWNQDLTLPDFLSWFESQAKSKEAQLQQMTEYLTNFSGFVQFLVGLIVIAVIPAIGEEFLFRGLLQNMFARGFGNHHAAIWLTALLFGAFHFQFYGVFPRMLLGVLFGYLYYWSGHLSLAMIGHFINNGFTLVTLYLYSVGIIDYDIAGDQELPPAPLLILFALIFRFYF